MVCRILLPLNAIRRSPDLSPATAAILSRRTSSISIPLLFILSQSAVYILESGDYSESRDYQHCGPRGFMRKARSIYRKKNVCDEQELRRNRSLADNGGCNPGYVRSKMKQ